MIEYQDENGLINMCKFCSTVSNPNSENKWVIVTNFVVNKPNNTKFVICPNCSQKN